MTDTTTTATPADAKPPPLRAFGEAAGLTAGLVHIIDDADDDQATEALLKVAGTAMFDHTVAQLRQNRIDRQARTEAAAHYAGQGYTVLDDLPEWRDRSKVALRYLRTADSHVATEEAVTDPVHWAVLLVQSEAFVDPQTGEMVDEDQVDWNTDDDPDAQPEDGLRHARTVVERTVWVPEFYCTDTEAAGLTLAEFLQNQRPIVHNPGGGDDQDDAAAAAARAEAERRERRKVLTLNKLGLAAQEVRRRFVTDLLRRRTAPKGSAQFIATCLAQSPNLPADYNAHQVVAQFLSLGDTPLKQEVCDLPANSDARAEVIVLGMLLAALEGRTPKDAWRDATSRYAQWRPPQYLKWLALNGYQLASVEQIVAGDRSSEGVYAEYCR